MIRWIISSWLDLEGPGIFAWLIGLYLTTAVVIHLACFRTIRRDSVLSWHGVVPPFFVAATTMFALMTAFLAIDVWGHEQRAAQLILQERDAVRAAHDISSAIGPATTSVHALTRAYLVSVLNDEWPLMQHEEESPKTTEALRSLLRSAVDPAIARQADPTIHRALLDAVLRIEAARSGRLGLSNDLSDDFKWTIVLILGVISQIGIAVVHLDRARPQILALLIFTASAVTTLGMIAVSERPFQGTHQVSPAPLIALLANLG